MNKQSKVLAVLFVFGVVIFAFTPQAPAQSTDTTSQQTTEQRSSGVDVGGVWRWQDNKETQHLEFTITGDKLVATFVYDDKALAGDYGERQPFFTAVLDGRRFHGKMDYYQSAGATIDGTISEDNKTIEFTDSSKGGKSVVSRTEQKEALI
jgi:hypothetical protein